MRTIRPIKLDFWQSIKFARHDARCFCPLEYRGWNGWCSVHGTYNEASE